MTDQWLKTRWILSQFWRRDVQSHGVGRVELLLLASGLPAGLAPPGLQPHHCGLSVSSPTASALGVLVCLGGTLLSVCVSLCVSPLFIKLSAIFQSY